MEKTILVLDEPKSCSNCRLCQYDWEGRRICAGEDAPDNDDHTSVRDNYYDDTKPNWCPLKPMPQKIDVSEDELYEKQYMCFEGGWNACIDEILGDTE